VALEFGLARLNRARHRSSHLVAARTPQRISLIGSPPTNDRIWSHLTSNPRELPFVLFTGLIAIGWGAETALHGDADALTRLAGAATAGGGALILLSYLFCFKPGSPGTPAWQQVPSRRRVAFVIRHLWLTVLIIGAAAWLASLIATR
jgi:hypothetical protein